MNKEETLALYARGKDAWNAWAKTMLDQRAEMEAAGTWAVGARGDPGNEATRAWLDTAKADFAGHLFEGRADFDGFLFPGNADFSKARFTNEARFETAMFSGDALFISATFSGQAWFPTATFSGEAWFPTATFEEAWFSSATFSGKAQFTRATFSGVALFMGAKFREDAEFRAATFSGSTRFDKTEFSKYVRFDSATFSEDGRFDSATFTGEAWFVQARFEGYTSFEKATFRQVARFTALHAERAFTLVRAQFEEVPGFVQAHFSEAPRLDNLTIPEVKGLWNCRSGRGKRDESTAARYRALKRLAIQAYDHTRELDYFASELKASRGVVLCIARFLYELLSNFGRWIALPLAWWGLTFGICAWAYLGEHFARAAEVGRGYAVSIGAWLWSWIASWISGTPAQQLRCLVEQEGNPWRAAWNLSLRRALPFPGVGSSEELYLIHTCLYGSYDESLKYTPVIPECVACLGIFQLLLSLILIFLFLLAVRNHFRIR